MKIKFKQWECIAALGYYNNGRKAITIYDEQTTEPVATATVNLPLSDCKDDEIFVKNYSENEGMTDALIEYGFIKKESTGSDRSGFEIIFKYKLTEKMMELFEALKQELEGKNNG